jgi:23S rRNA pseudouridine1911/1915/1917 synthase
MEGKNKHDIEVLYEDNHLLALNKPPGLLTQPAANAVDSLEARARDYVRDSRNKPGRVFLHAVHRLDRVASGVTLFALTDKALSRMNGQMRRNEIRRTYHALITGKPPGESGTLTHFLRHSRMKAVQAEEGTPGARLSRLGYRVLCRTSGLVLVEIVLETGRYHQIRAQLSAAGCPILGDSLYGGREMPGVTGIALHNREMEFLHPVGKGPISIRAAYPPSWPPEFSRGDARS